MTGFAQPGWVRLRPRKSRDVQPHSATLGAVRYDPFAAAHQTLDPYRHRVAEVYDRDRPIGELTTEVETWWTMMAQCANAS